jgi:vacuolar-type H+-ATPase subunit E/Vma4
LKNILDDLKLDLPVSYELNCWGGLIAKSGDGRVVVINTFESRLERATAFLRRYLAALFEEEQSEAKQVEVTAHP